MKEDQQVQRLLRSRVDIFPGYTQANFEAAFEPFFLPLEAQSITEEGRALYLMEKRP